MTVDENGLVTAVNGGTATITVTTNDGGYTAACDVIVLTFIEVPVTSVEIDEAEMALEAGSIRLLIATVLPEDADDKSVVWFSADESVATVDTEGLVTAVGEGITIICVLTVDGDFLAFCMVTVTGGS